MPPETPRTTLRPRSAPRSPVMGSAGVAARCVAVRIAVRVALLDRLGLDDLADLDLLERDRERLARHRRHLRGNDLAQSLAELVVVVVDLASPAGGQRDERELRVLALEEALDARLHQRCAPFGHVGFRSRFAEWDPGDPGS